MSELELKTTSKTANTIIPVGMILMMVSVENHFLKQIIKLIE